jgi:hypothetical protein
MTLGTTGFGQILLSSAVAAADGVAAKTEHFTTGVKFTANPQAMTKAPVGGTPCSLSTISGGVSVVEGYLLPNQ